MRNHQVGKSKKLASARISAMKIDHNAASKEPRNDFQHGVILAKVFISATCERFAS
ncbi:MAG: hypothetical protein WCJ38_05780 [Actinomycetes bacterium]